MKKQPKEIAKLKLVLAKETLDHMDLEKVIGAWLPQTVLDTYCRC